MKTVTLRELAHSRAGEKIDLLNVGVVAYRPEDYQILKEQLTLDKVLEKYGPISRGSATRYELPAIGALNFVFDGILDGGRTRTISFEESGKALASLILTVSIEVPDDFITRSDEMRTAGKNLGDGLTHDYPPAEGKKVRLGTAIGWARDRFTHADDLIENGDIDYLCFESMSEVTMSATQVANAGRRQAILYDPYLEKRLRPILARCMEKDIKIISNQGWADPWSAAKRVVEMAGELGIEKIKVAAVGCSNDLFKDIADMDVTFEGAGLSCSDISEQIVSVEVYLGANGIKEALEGGADVVITTRVVDSALYLGPLAYEFGWNMSDHSLCAKGSAIGHLMECGCHISGGYFADPGYKQVDGLENVGCPIAEVSARRVILTKTAQTGGVLNTATCKEQLLYEITDPKEYILPDAVVDFSNLRFSQIGKDAVEVSGFSGRKRPDTLKVLVGVREGYMNDEYVLFAGPGAMERAKLARHILLKRFEMMGYSPKKLRIDCVGLDSVHREASPPPEYEPWEVVLRLAVQTDTQEQCDILRQEVDAISMCGPSATGKYGPMSSRIRPVIGMFSALVPRHAIKEEVVFYEI